MATKYITFLFFSFKKGNKLEEALLDYIQDNYSRIEIAEKDLEDFKFCLKKKYLELSAKYPRCKFKELNFSSKFYLHNFGEFCLDRDFFQLRFLRTEKKYKP